MTRTRVLTLVCWSVSVMVLLAAPGLAWAGAAETVDRARDTGISGLWLLANLSYAGMRAQNHPSLFWRIITIVLGLPGTLLTVLFVAEGGERAYGVDLPRRRSR